jgi:hypothetical protein
MSAQRLEVFLARIYVDEGARARFRSDPEREARAAGLSEEEIGSLGSIDWDALELAARSFANKRRQKRRRGLYRRLTKGLSAMWNRSGQSAQ